MKPPVPTTGNDPLAWLRQIAPRINDISHGHMNTGGLITLAANAASTTITDDRISVDSTVVLVPTTANAAAEIAGVGKQSLWVPARMMTPRTTNGCAALAAIELATNKVMVETLDFDAVAIEYAQFSWVPPKQWDEGPVTAKFYWSHAATVTNFQLLWRLRGIAIPDNGGIDIAFTSNSGVSDVGGTTDRIYISDETPSFTIDGTPAESDFIIFEIERDATHAGDTLAIDGRLHGVQLFYKTNAPSDDTASGTPYMSETARVNGSIVISHANTALTDRTYRIVIIG